MADRGHPRDPSGKDLAPAPEAIDDAVLDLGRQLVDRMQGRVPGVFDRRHWEGKLLDRAMADPDFKTDLFRFIDVLPSLRRPEQVAEHVREYLLRDGRDLEGLLGVAVHLAAFKPTAGLAAAAVKHNVEGMARRFIVGRRAEDALPRLEELHREGFAFNLDLLGEATLSDVEADAYQARYADLIEHLPEPVSRWPEAEFPERNHLGPLPRAHVSIKVSALAPYLDPVDPVGGVSRLRARLLPLLRRAKESGVAVLLDLEQWELHDLTFDLFEEVATDPALRAWPHLGMAVQAYLRSAKRDLERLESVARDRGCPVAVRLVKGAYWETEVIRARQHGYRCPVHTEKAATDAGFEALTVWLLDRLERFAPAFGSHNLRSLAHAVVQARERDLPPEAVELQSLFGMAEPEREAFRSLGYRVRIYAPVGELLPGMAYFVRRLLENTSNEGFLRLTHRESADPASLLARPRPRGEAPAPSPSDRRDEVFRNSPLTDFADREAREAFAEAVAAAGTRLPREVPVVVDGQVRHGGRTLSHPCPSATEKTATVVSLATAEEADRAVVAAVDAWPAWRDRPVEERSGLLERLADRLQADRGELAALQVFEVGKPWREADADLAEAVDFCRYYARQARRELGPTPMGQEPGEANVLFYEGVGPAAVIAPWNFPLAILTGMTGAALVAGNPVILKPAEQSSAVGYALYERLIAAGFPPGVVQFLPGLGEEVGKRLARDPRVPILAFTGSRVVGLSLLETAGVTHPGQREVKRVVCEMGGKNAIVVDEDADLDAAVAGVVHGAFGYAGQKCSACSRVITVGEVHEPFVTRLVEAARSLPVGPAHDPAFRLGPVIDRDACDRLRAVLADPDPGATPLYVGPAVPGGHYVGPALFEIADPGHRLMQEELFGPVVAIHRAADFGEALATAVSTEYALTGSVYSRTPSHLERARNEFRVGNLYLNRVCTGSVVGRQPFGGFRMSGTGTKAGGPGYLLRFANPRCITESTVRRGFSPDVQI